MIVYRSLHKLCFALACILNASKPRNYGSHDSTNPPQYLLHAVYWTYLDIIHSLTEVQHFKERFSRKFSKVSSSQEVDWRLKLRVWPNYSYSVDLRMGSYRLFSHLFETQLTLSQVRLWTESACFIAQYLYTMTRSFYTGFLQSLKVFGSLGKRICHFQSL